MRIKLFAILLGMLMLTACATDSRQDELLNKQDQTVVDSIPTLHGEFMYLADAAVLKGDGFIYGVTIDSLSEELAERVRPLKTDDFDMVPVVVKAKISNNFGREGWDEVIEIREIIEIPTEDTTQIKVEDLEVVEP